MLDMKAKELRIGNIIPISGEVKQEIYHHNDEYHNSDYAELFEVSEGYVSFYVNHGNDYPWSIPIEGVKPIVLTPKVLEACGLNIYKGYRDKWTFRKEVGECIFIGYYNGYFNISGNPIDFNIQHLHQLQNLYFALTGQELEINIEKLK